MITGIIKDGGNKTINEITPRVKIGKFQVKMGYKIF
jgi:hypothetical protein